MDPTGPDRGAFWNRSSAVIPATVSPLTGEMGTGRSIVTFCSTTKATAFENDPVFAPSSAFARQ